MAMITIKHKGALLPVTNMFDIDGVETEDISLATTCVAKQADDEWLVIEVYAGDLIEENNK